MARIREKLNSSELKVQLDELIKSTSEIKDLMDSEGEQKVAELRAISGKLNTLLTYDVTLVEIKSIIETAEAEDVINSVKRGEIMAYMINKVTEENAKIERALSKC